jgi:hypothetical protein
VSHDKFDVERDDWEPELTKLTYWSTPHSGMAFRMPMEDVERLVAVLTEYLEEQ